MLINFEDGLHKLITQCYYILHLKQYKIPSLNVIYTHTKLIQTFIQTMPYKIVPTAGLLKGFTAYCVP